MEKGIIILVCGLLAFVLYLAIKVEKLEEKIEFLKYALKQTHKDFNAEINRVDTELHEHVHIKLTEHRQEEQ